MSIITLGVASGAVYGLVAVGIVLVYKATRVLNFAQAEFGTFALYLVWFLSQEYNVPWAVAALIAVVAMTVAGIGFERIIIRPMGDASKVSLSVATAGFLLLMFSIELKLWGPAPRLVQPPLRGTGVEIFGVFLTPMHLVGLGVLGVFAAGLGILVARTRLGLGLLAVASDPETARLMGVPYNRVAAFTWGTSGALGAAAGLIIGPLVGAFGPLQLSLSLFVQGLAAALLGGLTSLPGALIGGIAVGVLEAGLLRSFPGVPGIGSYGMLAVILLVLLLRPRGLLGRVA